MPFYSGKILITSSLGEVLSISYMGAAFDLKAHYSDIFSVPVVMTSSTVLIEKKPEYVETVRQMTLSQSS